MSNVIDLPVITTLDLDPERVLSKALEAKLTSVVILGTSDGGEFFSSSVSDGADVIWMLERAKFKLLQIVE